MDGFQKIDLDTPVKPSPVTANTPESSKTSSPTVSYSSQKRFRINLKNKKVLIPLLVVLLLFIVSIFAVLLPAQRTYSAAMKTYKQVKTTLDAVKKQNIELAGKELEKTKVELKETQNNLNSLSYLKFIPIASWYYNDADHLIKAGFHALDAATIFVDSVEPYADVLGLKGQGSFVGGSASQRIETAVKTMSKITPRIDDISAKLTLVKKEIDYVDPNHYPPFFGGEKIRSGLSTVRNLTDSGVTFVNDARPLIKILPDLLGEPNEKKYLVLFQNDKELRPTGGFITAYAVFRIAGGVIHVDSSSDIYELDAKVPNKKTAPKTLLQYMPKVPLFNLRDTNLSPDFIVSMKTFRDMYETIPGYPKVDGIIAVDTQALVAAMDILGDVQAAGATFTTTTDPRCNCPKVIYDLEVYADQPVQGTRTNRKDIIGDLMYSIMNKAFSSSPKLYWGPLFQEMLNQVAQKHVLFYMYNKDAQSGLEALNASGRIMAFDGDYLHINEANFGGAKANLFVSESVDQNYKVASDGTITKVVTINYKNPYEPSDCNLERGNLCLNAVLRNWFRVYVPKGSQLVDSKGSEVKMTSYEELGKTVFEGFMTVRPKGSAKVTLTYSLPFKLDSKSALPLMIQKQPGTNDNEYIINLNGKKIDKFKLLTDKTLKLNLK